MSGTGINNFQCAHSPSRLCVFDQTRNSTTALIAYDVATGARRGFARLTDDPYGVDWDLSPDGSTIAVLLVKERRIRFISVASGKSHDVTVKTQLDLTAITWSPDSKSVTIAGSDSGSANVLLQVDLHGTPHEIIRAPRSTPIT